MLKSNMFVRLKECSNCNIACIRKIDVDEEENKIWIDDYVYDEFGDCVGDIKEDNIEKASFCIADVLKKGDFINGKEIIEIIHYNEEKFYRIKLFGGKNIYNIKDIYSIMTKEQFDCVKYEVN